MVDYLQFTATDVDFVYEQERLVFNRDLLLLGTPLATFYRKYDSTDDQVIGIIGSEQLSVESTNSVVYYSQTEEEKALGSFLPGDIHADIYGYDPPEELIVEINEKRYYIKEKNYNNVSTRCNMILRPINREEG